MPITFTLPATGGAGHDPVTVAPVGSAPNANGASLAAQELTLQPADGTRPGLLTAIAQTIGGLKTFLADLLVQGNVTANDAALRGRRAFVDGSSGGYSGIQMYSEASNVWAEYMAPPNPGYGPRGNLTPPAGTYVTSWARRSVVDNFPSYGWIWESGGAAGTTPARIAELAADTGNFKTAGSIEGSNGAFPNLGCGVLTFGTSAVPTAAGTYFLRPVMETITADANEVRIRVPMAGRISALYVRTFSAPTGGTQTYTVRKNGVDTSLACTMALAAMTAQDTANGFTVAAGDEISVKLALNTGATGGGAQPRVTLALTAL